MKHITNMDELKLAQMQVRHKIELKEIELQAHITAVKEMLNPMTYVNRLFSKIAIAEHFAASVYKGYTTVRDLIAKYRSKNSADSTQEQEQVTSDPDKL